MLFIVITFCDLEDFVNEDFVNKDVVNADSIESINITQTQFIELRQHLDEMEAFAANGSVCCEWVFDAFCITNILSPVGVLF